MQFRLSDSILPRRSISDVFKLFSTAHLLYPPPPQPHPSSLAILLTVSARLLRLFASMEASKEPFCFWPSSIAGIPTYFKDISTHARYGYFSTTRLISISVNIGSSYGYKEAASRYSRYEVKSGKLSHTRRHSKAAITPCRQFF